MQRISGLSTTQVILISGIPWLAAIPAMLVAACGLLVLSLRSARDKPISADALRRTA